MINKKELDELIESVTEKDLLRSLETFEKIKPKTYLDYLSLLMFARLSVHTTVKSNVKQFDILLDNDDWIGNTQKTRQYLQEVGGGCHNIKGRDIAKMIHIFAQDPEPYCLKNKYKSFNKMRQVIIDSFMGLGLAKAAFWLEMIYPETCDVICIDKHLIDTLQIYDPPKKQEDIATYKSKFPNTFTSNYKKYERKFVKACKRQNKPPALVRDCLFEKSFQDQQRTLIDWKNAIAERIKSDINIDYTCS